MGVVEAKRRKDLCFPVIIWPKCATTMQTRDINSLNSPLRVSLLLKLIRPILKGWAGPGGSACLSAPPQHHPQPETKERRVTVALGGQVFPTLQLPSPASLCVGLLLAGPPLLDSSATQGKPLSGLGQECVCWRVRVP